MSTDVSRVQGFREGLRETGWVEGENIEVAYRFAEGAIERAPALIAELLALPVDVLLVLGGASAAAAAAATKTVPIVFAQVSDPVALGLVASFARPGGNLTGVTAGVAFELAGKRLTLLAESLPGRSRVGYLTNLAANPEATGELAATRKAATPLGIELMELDVHRAEDIQAAIAAAATWPADALQVVNYGPVLGAKREVVALVAGHRLPAIYGGPDYVSFGGLMNFAPDVDDLLRIATTHHLDRILRGTKPADIPVEQPTTFEFAVNRQTLAVLGLTLPPHVLLQVTHWVG